MSKLENNAKNMAEIFSLLDPYKIQEELFCLSENLTDSRCVELAKSRTTSVSALCRGLLSRGASVFTEGREYERYNIHGLLKSYLQQEMTDDSRQKAFDCGVAFLCASLTHIWDLDVHKIKEEFREYFPHVRALHDFYIEKNSSKDGYRLNADFEFVHLLHKAAS